VPTKFRERLWIQSADNPSSICENGCMSTSRTSPSSKTKVSTPQAPSAIGPYSQAVVSGDFLYTSGQVALDPASGQMIEGGIREQTTRVLENLKAVLAAAGSDLGKVVKTVVFLKNMQDFSLMNEVYAVYLAPEGAVPPARSTVEVARLPKDALVEIEVIARM
jgi:2-iminobutanoate/2-iminopropanoate deaminase